MDYRTQMLSVIQGKPVQRIPYVPRLDLWYNANKRAGTLPKGYEKADLFNIADDLNIGFHAIVPQFKDIRTIDDEIHRALGVYNLKVMPCKTVFENVKFSHRVDGDATIVNYKTPKGDLQTRVVYDEGMKKAGITISHLAECAIKSHKDYEAVAFLFDNARVEPNYDGFSEYAAKVGNRGLTAGFLSLAGSPMHLLLRELMPFDLMCYEQFDHLDELLKCAESIGRYFDRVFDVAAKSPAQLFLFGANYDVTLTNPPFFKDHITPWLKKFADILHARGKYLLTHTDGENTGILPFYLESGFDIADSICPKPMTKLTMKEVRDEFKGRITILGGIPSVCLMKSSLSDREFEAYMENFMQEIGRGDHIILGISDTTPPQADFERLKKVRDYIEAFGPVKP